MLISLPAFAEKECWYEYQYRTHDYEQTDLRLPTCTSEGYYAIECIHSERHTTGPALGRDCPSNDTRFAGDSSACSPTSCSSACARAPPSVLRPESAFFERDKRLRRASRGAKIGSLRAVPPHRAASLELLFLGMRIFRIAYFFPARNSQMGCGTGFARTTASPGFPRRELVR